MLLAASFLDFQRHPGHLYVLATLLPLVSFVILFLGGRRWGRVGAYIATAAIGAAFILSVIGFFMLLPHLSHGHDDHGDHGHSHGKFAWKNSMVWARLSGFTSDTPGIELRLGYSIDSLAAVMFVMVTFIAMLIHIYSMGYMADELTEKYEDHQAHVTRRGRCSRFFMFLSLFCFSMLNLVLADNLFQVFLSWELVGICSYLLIGFYYERRSATNAANKAFITNRIGDAGFIIGLLIFWTYCGTFNFDELNNTIRCYPEQDAHKPLVLHNQVVRGEPAESNPRSGLNNLVISKPGQEGRLVLLFPKDIPVNDRDPRLEEYHYHGPTPGGEFQLAAVKFYVTDDDLAAAEKEGTPAELIARVKQLKVREFPSEESYRMELQTVISLQEIDAHWPALKKAAELPGTIHVTKQSQHSTMPYWLLVVGGLGIFMGCVGKSAQFPLQVWLPDAMEGPTPVSALIHAATMVAAGVYLVGRAFPLFTPEVLLTIAYVGGITLFVAATIAIVQTDIKKVLAYSTVSQLGFMMLALGVGGWAAGLFHLITHAFFKALLFLCSGSVIYGCHHEQEMTKMGGLYPKMKVTALTMLVGVLAIAGTPFFSGWYSKDAVLVSSLSFVSLHPQHFLLFVLPIVTAGITAFYMFRLWFMTFTGAPRDHHVYEHAHESPALMSFPLIVLAIFSVIVAWGANPLNVQGSFLETKLLHASQPETLETDEATRTAHIQFVNNQFDKSIRTPFLERNKLGPHDIAGILALLSAGIGVIIAVVIYYWAWLDPDEAKAQFAGLHRFLWHKWYFDEFYRWALVRPSMVVAYGCRWIDANIIDGFINWLGRFTVRVSNWDGRFDMGIVDGLVNVTGNTIFAVGNWLRVVQTGSIRNYILFLAVAAIGLFVLVSYVFAM